MFRQISTAVAVAASAGVRAQIMHALAESGVELLCMEREAVSALEALQHFSPGLLIADQQLPGLDGASLLCRVFSSRRLSQRPAILLLYDAVFALPRREQLAKAGAVLLEKPLNGVKLIQAVQLLCNTPPRFPAQEILAVQQLLDALGMPEHPGRDCLKTAALICASDARMRGSLSGMLYPAVGKVCGLSAAQAERSIRHVIDLAWQSNEFENQYRIFADTVDAGRGQPTCGEMISRLADILRLEG